MSDKTKFRFVQLGVLSAALVLAIVVYQVHPINTAIESRQSAVNQLYLAEYRDRSLWFRDDLDLAMSNVRSSPVPAKPTVSVPGGFYDQPQIVGLSADINPNDIYYTLDGAIPTKDSRKYAHPIQMTGTSTLRARVISSGDRPGTIATETYIIGEEVQLPILAIASDPTGLFDPYAGVYRNPFERGKGWHREAVITYISQGRDSATNFDANISIHGNYTRDLPKKSWRIRYEVDESIMPGLPAVLKPHQADVLNQVVLRQGGDDYEIRLRVMLFDSIYKELGGITTPYETVFVYINGQAMGVFNIREHLDANFLKKHFGAGGFDLVVDSKRVLSGDINDYFDIIDFLESHDMSDDKNFAAAARRLNVTSIADYWIANIFAANVDWPARNTYFFRSHEAGGKWRPISWDVDITFDLYETELPHNTLAFATRDKLRDDLLWEYTQFDRDNDYNLRGTVLIRNLLKNDNFRAQFIRRFLDLLNWHFRAEYVEGRLQSLIAASSKDDARDRSIWSVSDERYQQHLELIRRFISNRPQIVREQLRERFTLGSPVTVRLAVSPAGSGKIAINDFEPSSLPTEGTYFKGVSVTLVGIPAPGYRFAGWADPEHGENPEISASLISDTDFVANFEPIPD